LWLNAMASKFADNKDAAGGEADKKSKRPRPKKKETA
jgi:hypothetical protein